MWPSISTISYSHKNAKLNSSDEATDYVYRNVEYVDMYVGKQSINSEIDTQLIGLVIQCYEQMVQPDSWFTVTTLLHI